MSAQMTSHGNHIPQKTVNSSSQPIDGIRLTGKIKPGNSTCWVTCYDKIIHDQ